MSQALVRAARSTAKAARRSNVVTLNTQRDPIFGAVAAYYAAYAPYSKAVLRWQEFPADVLRRPQAQVGNLLSQGQRTPIYCHSEAMIDAHFDELIENLKIITPNNPQAYARQDELRAAAKQQLANDRAALKKLRDECGFTAVDKARDRAMDKMLAAKNALLRTKPTTMEGVATLAALVRRRFKDGEWDEWEMKRALANFAR